MVCLPQVAQLSVEKLSKIKKLENEIGLTLIAYQPMEFANLTEKGVKDLQKLEKNLGTTVIAYK
jgi:hypothetical protein